MALEASPAERMRPDYDDGFEEQNTSVTKNEFEALREGSEFTVNGHGPFVVEGEPDNAGRTQTVWRALRKGSDSRDDGVMIKKAGHRSYKVRVITGGGDAWVNVVRLRVDNEGNLQDWVHEPTYDWLQKREGDLVLWAGNDEARHFQVVRVGPTRDGKVAVNTDEWPKYGGSTPKVDDKTAWTSVPDALDDYDEPEKFTLTEYGVTERGMEWTDQILIPVGAIPDQIEQVTEADLADSPLDQDSGVLDGVEITDSGITRDDSITEITGIGDSSDLITDMGIQTVGEWWDIGAPFFGVAGGWHDDALHDLLGAEFVDPTNPQDLVRVFTGYTAGNVYDENGEKLGGLPGALFGDFPWEQSAWAWYYGNLRKDEYQPSEADNPDGTYQFAFATGEDVPRDVLTFESGDGGLTGLHDVADAATTLNDLTGRPVVRYPAEGVEGAAYPPKPTVEFMSTLFGTDFTNPTVARDHVEVVIKEGASRPSADYVTVFHHPTADAHALIEGDNIVMPEDFDLTGEVYDPVEEWARKAAEEAEDRQSAFEEEMANAPDYIGRSALSERMEQFEEQHRDAVGAHPFNDYRNADREDPNELEEFEEMMSGVYDPTQESADQDDAPAPKHFGDYRREKVEQLENTPHLDPIESFDSLDEMVAAIEAIHVEGYSSPPEKTISKLRANFEKLPSDEAERYYLNDYKLTRTINSARRHFNKWVGRKKKYDQMPGAMEAGPSNYPKKKQNRLRDSARKAREKLDEKLDRLNGRVKGALQRALKKAGTSEGEINEQRREETREDRREEYEKGDLAFWSDTVYGKALWGVKRVNKKSLRLRRPHSSAGMEKPMSDGEVYPEYDETRADLDSDRLQGPIPAEKVAEFDADDAGVRAPEDYIPARVDTAREARIAVFGEEWVEDNLDDQGDDRPDPSDDTTGDQLWMIDLDGIGKATENDLNGLGIMHVRDLKEAYNEGGQRWNQVLDALPTEQARRSVYDAIGVDPDATVADAPEQVATDGGNEELMEYFAIHDDGASAGINGPFDTREEAEHVVEQLGDEWHVETSDERGVDLITRQRPSVGNFLWIDYADGGGFSGTVTRVEDGEAMIRVSEGDTPLVWDWNAGTVTTPKGKTHDVKRVERTAEDAEAEMTDEDPVTGNSYDAPGADDLADVLAAKGVNNITAHNLGEQYDTIEALREAAEAADQITDLYGVGAGSADEVRAALGMADQAGADDQDDDQDTATDGGDAYQGGYKNQRMEDAHYWAAQLLGWMKNGPNAGLRGTYYVDVLGGKPVLVMDGDEWNDSTVKAIKDGLRDYGFPSPLRVKDLDDEFRLFVSEPTDDRLVSEPHPNWREFEATGGDGGDPAAMFAEDQLDTWDTPNPNTDDDQDTATDGGTQAASGAQSDSGGSDDGSLPWQARKVLGGAWGKYKAMLAEGNEARQEVQEYRELREEGKDAAAAINEVRRAHGQEPIDFDGVDEIEGVEEVGGPLLPEDTGSSFEWDASGTYDPTEEFE